MYIYYSHLSPFVPLQCDAKKHIRFSRVPFMLRPAWNLLDDHKIKDIVRSNIFINKQTNQRTKPRLCLSLCLSLCSLRDGCSKWYTRKWWLRVYYRANGATFWYLNYIFCWLCFSTFRRLVKYLSAQNAVRLSLAILFGYDVGLVRIAMLKAATTGLWRNHHLCKRPFVLSIAFRIYIYTYYMRVTYRSMEDFGVSKVVVVQSECCQNKCCL